MLTTLAVPDDGNRNRKKNDGDTKKFTPKNPPGEIWGVMNLKEKNAKNNKVFRKAYYQEAIHRILENTRKHGIHNSVTIEEMIPLIQEHFVQNNIKYKVNRKSIESALKKMKKDFIFIKAELKSVKYENGYYDVLGFRYMDDTEQAIATIREIAKIMNGLNS